ncbi:RraA family protein [Roseixanthobacter liquoris]|uniref:RraA family protein n=1 Tax=Roseixanthobacter liquoris TaxID=3119921 RepID=UPI00372BE505
MPDYPFTRDDLERLKQWDTATICNGLELVVPGRRTVGFTLRTMIATERNAPPMVGLARVGTMRAKEPPRGPVADRLDWYDYVADAALPTVVVLQDTDDQPGYGAIWGEVHSTVHKALGALGCITNGSFRDWDMLAPGFQILAGSLAPSHAHSHFVDFGRAVNVFGMQVGHDDVVHADYQGAVVIPADAVRKLPDALDLLARREAVILEICKDPAFTPAKLKEAIRRSGEIH